MKLHYIIPCILSLCNVGISIRVVGKYSRPINAHCTKELNPQVYGSLQCKYENPCLAEYVGCNVTADCKLKEVVEKCSLPKKRKYRKKKNLQVCGSLQCEYKNKCLAKTAGYNAKADCKPVEVAEKCSIPKKKDVAIKRTRRYVVTFSASTTWILLQFNVFKFLN